MGLGIDVGTLQHEIFISLLNKARTVWNSGMSIVTKKDIYIDDDSHIKFHIMEVPINNEQEFWSCVKEIGEIFPTSICGGYISQMLADARIMER